MSTFNLRKKRALAQQEDTAESPVPIADENVQPEGGVDTDAETDSSEQEEESDGMPSGPGFFAGDERGFWMAFEEYIDENELQDDLVAYKRTRGIDDEDSGDFELESALNFLRGHGKPDWAFDFCPGHDMKDVGNENYVCQVCGLEWSEGEEDEEDKDSVEPDTE
jgi:hypothetical protein